MIALCFGILYPNHLMVYKTLSSHYAKCFLPVPSVTILIAIIACLVVCVLPLKPFETRVYCFLLPVPSLLGARQENDWLSCPTVQEVAGPSRPPNEQTSSIEERCHFPFWYKGRLRYECVKLDTSSTSSQVN